jgi:hypothetical protein
LQAVQLQGWCMRTAAAVTVGPHRAAMRAAAAVAAGAAAAGGPAVRLLPSLTQGTLALPPASRHIHSWHGILHDMYLAEG